MHDEFVAALTRRVAAMRLGSGLEAGTTQGPLISAAAVDRVGCGACRVCIPCAPCAFIACVFSSLPESLCRTDSQLSVVGRPECEPGRTAGRRRRCACAPNHFHPSPLPPCPFLAPQVEEKVRDAVAKGAQVACGGARPSHAGGPLAGGFFYQPTVLTGGWQPYLIQHAQSNTGLAGCHVLKC